MAGIDANNSRSVKQCYNTKATMRPFHIVRSNRRLRKTIASPLTQSRARDQERITNYFFSSRRFLALDVRGASYPSLPVRRGFRPPRIASPTPLNPSRSPTDTLKVIIGDYTMIDNIADSPLDAHED
eukprot:Gb_28734 [translate_table: standard]